MCFENCLKGRTGKCCFGCSTRVGIHLIAALTLAEVFLIAWIFCGELTGGILNLKVIMWLAITLSRTFAYFAMCCDSISKRKVFMITLIFSTIVELILFTIMNFGLFDGSNTEKVFTVLTAWGLGTWVQILLMEFLSFTHLIMFTYFISIAFEYYTFARDDPSMIDREHEAMAADAKKAAAERKRAE